MPTLRDVIDEALQTRLPNCPPELRDRIVEMAMSDARAAVKTAVLAVLKDADLTFAYADVDRFRAEREERRAARVALREAARELRERLDDDDDDDAAAVLADRIAELGPRSTRVPPIRLVPDEGTV